MISGYLSNERFSLARELFNQMPERDFVSWNVMISGCVKKGKLSLARELFERMPVIVSWNTMLPGYAHNACVDEARQIFDRMPCKNGVSWNALLATYVHNGRIDEAARLFKTKKDWELVSWNCLMGGFVKMRRLEDARRVFDKIREKDVISWNTIITVYVQHEEVAEARRLFDESPTRDVFTWTAMVSGYAHNGMIDEARIFFDEMPERNAFSWNAMIAEYVQSKRMDMARELFEDMTCKNVTSWNTMITGYAQNGEIPHARNLFDRMPRRDSISWSAMIAGYAQSGYSEEALQLFAETKRKGERLNRSSFTCALSTCANIAVLELGKQLHVHVQLVKAGYDTGCFVVNALLAMYCKCGSIEAAYNAFEEISEKGVISWNTIIAGYARHGFGKEALMVFDSMKNAGIGPDSATMVGVLSACSHTGLVERGTEYFYSMSQDYGITAHSAHYTCMIDLLGRSERLNEALNLMKNMPFEPDAATWGALLGASRKHGNTTLGEKAGKGNICTQHNAGMYVLLSNLYAASGRWSDISKMRLKMRDTGVRKVPGYSWLKYKIRSIRFQLGTQPTRRIIEYMPSWRNRTSK